jgi:putative ABC transport system permease protein
MIIPSHQISARRSLRGVIEDFGQDLRYAARTLRRQPGFSLAVALTLALGLGLNATVFGMMDALLLRPFQFADYERLVVLWETPLRTSERQQVSPANYRDWKDQTRSVQSLVGWEGWSATLTGRDEPERVQGFRVSAGFFGVLGVAPSLGRSFISNEELPGNDRRVVIGDGLWKRRFGGDRAVVGTEVLLDGAAHTVVGVAPPGFNFPVGAEIWAPLSFTPERSTDRSGRSLTVLGKLASSRSLADAQSELDIISRRLEQQFPVTNRERGVTVRTLSTAFREDTSTSFVGILQAGAGLVLLIACFNLAGLLLARANDRQRELAVRSALGASRIRIVTQLATETMLLGLVASVLALLLAGMGLHVLRSSMPVEIAHHIEGWNNVRLDSRLISVIPLVAVGLGLVFGLIPAMAATRDALTAALKQGERGTGGSVPRQRIRQALVAAEIAFALALLVAASLAFDAGIRMVNQSGGFDTQRLLTFDIPVPDTKYRDVQSRRQLASALLDRIEAIPGVEGAALANILPAAGWSPTVDVTIDGDAVDDPARRPRAGFRAVSSGYFATMRIPIVGGRSFSTADREDTQHVAIVSASTATRFWPGRDPIGRRLRLEGTTATWVTVVGVAADVTMYNWWDGIDYSAVYVPLRQSTSLAGISAAVRTHGEPASIGSGIRSAVASADPLLAIDRVRTMQQAIVDSTFGLSFMATLMAICGAFALVLSFVGTYSMMAYAVSQRIHEFGVRMALGATGRDVLRAALKQASVLTGIGLIIGLLLAAVLAQLMSSAIAGILVLDPAIFLSVGLLLAIVSSVAAYVPARRSLRLDPAKILRAS